MKAIKIWNHEVNKKDTYLDFKGTFSCEKQGFVPPDFYSVCSGG